MSTYVPRRLGCGAGVVLLGAMGWAGLVAFASETKQVADTPADTSAPGAAAAQKPATEKPATAGNPSKDSAAIDGRELFVREWLPHDARARGGDGLGPVFNDTSCVACHNQGGAGGGGPSSKNVDIITAFAQPAQEFAVVGSASAPEAMFRALFGDFGREGQQVQTMTVEVDADTETKPTVAQTADAAPVDATKTEVVTTDAAQQDAAKPDGAAQEAKRKAVAKQKQELAKIHPGFLSARSVVLHKAATLPEYHAWRLSLKGQNFGLFDQLTVASDGAVIGVDFDSPDAAAVAEASTVATVAAEAPPPVGPTATEAAVAVNTAVDLSASAQSEINQHRVEVQQFRSRSQGTQATVGGFTFFGSQRNPTALFGAGDIDAIPEKAILANAGKTFPDFPEIQGRVARLKDGRIGRFGWKAQTASLKDFTLTACAVELGLDVPNHPQAGIAQKPSYAPPGYDLSQAECDALIRYIADLPTPSAHPATSEQERETRLAGERQFAAVGCAHCHTPNLGNAKGIYSDLLLHDMGDDLGDTGSYGTFVPNSPEEGEDEFIPSLQLSRSGGETKPTAEQLAKQVGALRQEWRTPPLWGVRDSAPYLHDGRADTLEQAIALHGGAGAKSAQKFFALKPAERLQLLTFLKSLAAPMPQVAAK